MSEFVISGRPPRKNQIDGTVDVNIVGGSSSGTQYTEGDTDASITGTAMMFETNTGTSALGVVSATNPLPISDNSTTISVDDGAGSLTVDGTVAATQSGTWNINNVSGTVSLPTGAATEATLGSVKTSVELIDDTVVADDAAFTPATTKVLMAGFEFDDVAPDSVNEGDAGAARMSANRNIYTQIRDAAGNERGVNVNASNQLTVSVDNNPVLGSGTNGIGKLTANSGVDIGDVTVNNGAGVDAVNIQDGGNSITVDGSVSVSGAVDTELTTADLDTGGGTDTRAVVGLVGSASGGGQLIPGSSTDGLLVNLGANNDVTVTGTVAVTQSGTWDEVGINDSGNSITVDNSTLSVVGGGTEATALRVTIASDSTGVLSVDDNGSTLSIDDGAGSITVDNGGTFAVQATIAAGATNIAKAEDAASADADVGVPAMAVRKATPANTSGLDGDYEMLQMSAGRLWTSATIDAALPAGTNAIGKLAANSGVDIGDVDVTSVVPGTGATNLGKAEDAAHTTGDVGVMALAVRNDGGTALAGTDGDYIPLTTDNTGALRVTGGGGGYQYAEDSASANGDYGTVAMTIRRDTATMLAGTDGDYAAMETNTRGALWVAIENGSGSQITSFANTEYQEDDGAALNPVGPTPILVRADTPAIAVSADGDNVAHRATKYGAAYTQIVTSSGSFVDTFGGGTEYTEDAASAADPVGTMLIARRRDAPASEVSADGDNIALNATSKGALYIAPVGGSMPVDDNGSTISIDDGSGSITVDGTVTVNDAPTSSGGYTKYHLISAGSTNATNIKASAGQVYAWSIYNSATTARKVAFHDTSGTPTAGSSVYFTVHIPPLSVSNIALPSGTPFSSGIAITTVTGMADTDATAVTANDLGINIFYK